MTNLPMLLLLLLLLLLLDMTNVGLTGANMSPSGARMHFFCLVGVTVSGQKSRC